MDLAVEARPKVEFALDYARLGCRVFPAHWIYPDGKCSCRHDCGSAAKHPIEKHWQQQATKEESRIRWWWTRNPEANIGVACGKDSNLTVLDVDGDIGRDTLHDLEMEHGELPQGPLAITGRGGNHYYFKYEPSLANAVRFAPGLDIRTEGGLVIGVGSKTTGPYLWDANFTLDDKLMPPQMPEWLIRAVHEKQALKNGAGVKLPDEIHEGEGRNNALWKVGRGLKAKNLPESAIRAGMLAANQSVCKPPMESSEIEKLIKNVIGQPDRAAFKAGSKREQASESDASGEFGVRASTIVEESIYWVIPGYVAKGKLHELIGDPEVVKTTTLIDWCARITTGRGFCGIEIGPAACVAFLSNEDGIKDTLTPRLRVAGADLSKVRFFPRAFESVNEDGEVELTPLVIPKHLSMIEQQIVADGIVFFVIDPVESFFPDKTDTHNNASTRKVLAELDAMAERALCAIVSIRHLNKMGSVDRALYRGGGSIAFMAASRVSMIIAPDPTEHGMRDDDPMRRHVLATVKNNLWPREPSRAFRKAVGKDTIDADHPKGIVHIEWIDGTVPVVADDLLRPQHKERNSEAITEAVDFLLDELIAGDKPLEEIKEKARGLGISEATLRRARKKAGVKSRKKGFTGPRVLYLVKKDDSAEGGDDDV